MDLLRQEFDPTVTSRLETRKSIHQSMRGGGSDPTGEYTRRLNAWAMISIPEDGEAPVLSMSKEGYESRYRSTMDNKPTLANLTSISIKRVTGRAEKMNLTLEIDVEFEVFTFDAFEVYSKAYLRRHPERKPLKIEWGNGSSYSGRGATSGHVIEGAMVLAGGYSTTELNTYKCRFTAIGPANALLELDVLSCGDLSLVLKPQDQTFKYTSFGYSTGEEKVSSIPEKIMYDLQSEGRFKTKDYDEGYEPISSGMDMSTTYLNGGSSGGSAPVGKIFEYFQGSGFSRWWERNTNFSDEDTAEASDAFEFVSLEYVVDLINKTLIEFANRKCKKQIEFKIVFADEPYSHVPTKFLGGRFRSADPMSVLFLGNGSGTYLDTGEEGKDFEEVPGYFSDCVSPSRETVNHRKILISRRVIVKRFFEILEEQNEAKEDKKRSDRDRIDRVADNSFKIKDFFNNIFEAIAKASGYYVNLSFVNTDVAKGSKGKDLHVLVIEDVFCISKKAPEPFMIDPIRGDGNCFSVSIEGKLPTDLVALSFIPGLGEGSGTAGLLSEDKDYLIEVTEQYGKAFEKLTSSDEKIGVFAKMAKKKFNPTVISEAISILSEFKKIATAVILMRKQQNNNVTFTEYFDIEMKMEMEGIYPIIAGNNFTASNLPKFARTDNKLCFVALDIEDKIEAPGIWTTSVQSRLTPYL